MMCGNEQAAPWCLVLTGKTTAATESEAATLKLPDVAADVFPTIHPSFQEEAARLRLRLQNTFFPPFLDPAISSSVFLTTATDVIGFFTFLGLSALVIL